VILAGLFSGFAVEVHAQTCEDGGACDRSSPHKVLHVDGDTYSLQSAIAAANRSRNTSVIISSNQTLTAGLTLTGTGVELTCQKSCDFNGGRRWILDGKAFRYDRVRAELQLFCRR